MKVIISSDHGPYEAPAAIMWFALVGFMTTTLIATVMILWAALAVVSAARAEQPLEQLAHEDYAWVRAPQYLTASGRHCCSEAHCRPAMAGELTPIPGGWRHNPTGLTATHDKPGIYQTEDPAGRVFRCVYGQELCVFEGVGG